MRTAILLLVLSAAAPPEVVYAAAAEAAAKAQAIRIAEGTDTAAIQSRLDQKARLVADALKLAPDTIADQPYEGRSYGHRLVAAVLLDLAGDLQPVASDRARHYRDEAAVAYRLCASFDVPGEVKADCQKRLEVLEKPDVASIVAAGGSELGACLKLVKGKFEWKGRLTARVGEHGVESAVLVPEPAGKLAPLVPCVTAWARKLPLPGPLDVEVPLVLRSVD